MSRIYSTGTVNFVARRKKLIDLFTLGILYRFAEFSINYLRASDVVFIRDNRTSTKDLGGGRFQFVKPGA